MTDFDAAAVRALLDREAIRAVLTRYCQGVDRRDEALLRTVFHPDATDSHGEGGPAWEFAAAYVRRDDGEDVAMHYVTNSTIVLEGDVAHVESYWFHVGGARFATSGRNGGGRYLDRFERRDGEWKIAERTVVYEWVGAASFDFPEAARHFLLGTRDRSDPVYREVLRAAGIPGTGPAA
jgi:hypothetical protein